MVSIPSKVRAKRFDGDDVLAIDAGGDEAPAHGEARIEAAGVSRRAARLRDDRILIGVVLHRAELGPMEHDTDKDSIIAKARRSAAYARGLYPSLAMGGSLVAARIDRENIITIETLCADL